MTAIRPPPSDRVHPQHETYLADERQKSPLPRALSGPKCCGANEGLHPGTQVQNPGSPPEVGFGPSVRIQRCPCTRDTPKDGIESMETGAEASLNVSFAYGCKILKVSIAAHAYFVIEDPAKTDSSMHDI